jgi:hypothetical protein
MVHARKQTRLALKLFPQSLVGKQRLLQRDHCVEAFIDRFVDRAHATLPKQTDDAIPAL